MSRVSIGTRVVLIGSREGAGAGSIVAIRNEPWLRPYEIELDAGVRIYASAEQVAAENDNERTPLGPSLHDD